MGEVADGNAMYQQEEWQDAALAQGLIQEDQPKQEEKGHPNLQEDRRFQPIQPISDLEPGSTIVQ